MKVIKISILLRKYHTDYVNIYTDLPTPFPPDISEDNLVLNFQTQRKKGLEYVRENFKDVKDVEIIDGDTGKKTYLEIVSAEKTGFTGFICPNCDKEVDKAVINAFIDKKISDFITPAKEKELLENFERRLKEKREGKSGLEA